MNVSSIKELLKKKQQYMLLGAMALLGMILIALGNQSGAEQPQHLQAGEVEHVSVQTAPQNTYNATELEQKLAYTLSQIQGVGSVTVQITTRSTGRKEYAANTQHISRATTEESDGTIRQTTELEEQANIVQHSQSGMQQALLIEETAPEIAGVLVVAVGAEDAIVQEQLLQAVAALLQVSLHQIVVVPGEEAL